MREVGPLSILADDRMFEVAYGVMSGLLAVFFWMVFAFVCRFWLREDAVLSGDLSNIEVVAQKSLLNMGRVVWNLMLVCVSEGLVFLCIDFSRKQVESARSDAVDSGVAGLFEEDTLASILAMTRSAYGTIEVLAYVMLGVIGLVFFFRLVRVVLYRLCSGEVWFRVLVNAVGVVLWLELVEQGWLSRVVSLGK